MSPNIYSRIYDGRDPERNALNEIERIAGEARYSDIANDLMVIREVLAKATERADRAEKALAEVRFVIGEDWFSNGESVAQAVTRKASAMVEVVAAIERTANEREAKVNEEA